VVFPKKDERERGGTFGDAGGGFSEGYGRDEVFGERVDRRQKKKVSQEREGVTKARGGRNNGKTVLWGGGGKLTFRRG